ncbi:nucleoside deaminase [Sphingobium sp. Z007]|uniref:nucleoside deaminase n=1 Tax=Sphingobium sp. Z007 TaxID=627495 RepID=UPI000B49FAE1|nr:nucleoside deaminase [Sphingobium sp. Z007]
MIGEIDKAWMREAIKLAKSKGTSPQDTPIAAIIVLNGRELARAVNQTEELLDATAHAEMMAFRRAGKAHGDMDIRDATLYSTLQPCGMCTMASIWAKIGRIVYGAGRDDVHRMYFEDRHLDTVDFIQDAWREDLVIDGGCLRDECAALYFGPDDDVPIEEQGNI